jgi:hypothetical protein
LKPVFPRAVVVAFVLAQGFLAGTVNFSVARAAGVKAVLIAGDGSLPVFDNAVSAMERMLRGGGVEDIHRLTANKALVARGAAALATPENILATIAAMRPGPGQTCLVYATSHGAEGVGLVLSATDEALDPTALDAALLRGCGNAPTAIVMSGCFSGIYAEPPMTRPNRIILTAARPDRSSFGCQAGRVFTVYDQCLLNAVADGGRWVLANVLTKTCVMREERREAEKPSEPRAWFGDQVRYLTVPGTG